MVASKNKPQNSERLLDAVDTGTAVLGLAHPMAGAIAVGIKALGRGAFAEWTVRDAKKQHAQLEAVLLNAFTAIVSGDPDLAAAEIDACLDNPKFVVGIRATTAKMLESDPCSEALRPLGLLVAVYLNGELRPDPTFRRIAALLCDLDATSYGGLDQLLRLLDLGNSNRFTYDLTPGAPDEAACRFITMYPRSTTIISHREWGALATAVDLMVEHGIAAHDSQTQRSSGFGDPVSEQATGVDGAQLVLLKKLFGICPLGRATPPKATPRPAP